MGFGVQSVRPI